MFFGLCLSAVCFAQPSSNKTADKSGAAVETLKSSPAFAEIILRRTELRAEIESLLISYTEEFPKIKGIRLELDVLNRELNRLLLVKPAESQKLTFALGKLIVRKAEIEADYSSLQTRYGDEHQDVKRAKRKVEIFEGAIKAILD